MSIGRDLREHTRRQHLATIEHHRRQLNVPSRSDWYKMQNTWAQLGQESRDKLGGIHGLVLRLMPEPPEPIRDDEPVPRWTKESMAKVRAAMQRATLTRSGFQLTEKRGDA